MSFRRRALPRGWYPDEAEAIRESIAAWTASARGEALAAIAPHAGWAFSGRLAALAVASLAIPDDRAGSTLVVVGGHLPPGARPLAARESGYETPLGPVEADLELLRALESSMPLGRDEEPDNTVEVLLPFAAALFPGLRALWLRAPGDGSAIELGQALRAAELSTGRRLACVGSTDLTHYGPNYGFSPRGRGPAAESWVREVNDRRFIEAIVEMDAPKALARGEAERSACSPGAAVAALSYAKAAGAARAALLGYATSLDVRRDDSFVGYAALAFYSEPSA